MQLAEFEEKANMKTPDRTVAVGEWGDGGRITMGATLSRAEVVALLRREMAKGPWLFAKRRPGKRGRRRRIVQAATLTPTPPHGNNSTKEHGDNTRLLASS
jgi:hypothetical protein